MRRNIEASQGQPVSCVMLFFLPCLTALRSPISSARDSYGVRVRCLIYLLPCCVLLAYFKAHRLMIHKYIAACSEISFLLLMMIETERVQCEFAVFCKPRPTAPTPRHTFVCLWTRATTPIFWFQLGFPWIYVDFSPFQPENRANIQLS